MFFNKDTVQEDYSNHTMNSWGGIWKFIQPSTHSPWHVVDFLYTADYKEEMNKLSNGYVQ